MTVTLDSISGENHPSNHSEFIGFPGPSYSKGGQESYPPFEQQGPGV